MNDAVVIEVLNELLAAEQRAIAPRLFEADVFVSSASVAVAQLADQMAAQSAACQRTLAECVSRLGGEPRLRSGSLRSADLHFQELHHMLPRLIDDHGRLVAKYRAAGARLGDDPASAAMVARFLQAHEQVLDALTKMAAPTVTT